MKMRSIGEKGPAETLLSYRAAREVARGLRARGWAVTGALCRGKTPAQVARMVLLGSARASEAEVRLAGEIAVMCGYVPAEVEG